MVIGRRIVSREEKTDLERDLKFLDVSIRLLKIFHTFITITRAKEVLTCADESASLTYISAWYT